jgi:hypothetical protein
MTGPHLPDPCVVETNSLADVIETALAKRPEVGRVTDFLAERTRDADPVEEGVSIRAIKRVLKRERDWTELSVADQLLVAVRRVDALRDGSVEIVPNPDPRKGCGCSTYEPVVPDQEAPEPDDDHHENGHGNGLVADALDRLRAEERPAARRKHVALPAAITWLAGYLSQGALPSQQVVAEARARGFSAMTVDRARSRLRCETFQRGRRWWVSLP